jgi:hypothetical protein
VRRKRHPIPLRSGDLRRCAGAVQALKHRFSVLLALNSASVSNVNAANADRRVTIAARVPPDLAPTVAGLAATGDGTISREVASFRAHVQESTVGQRQHVDARTLSPFRPQTPAARVRELDPAGSRSPAQRAGEGR